jgi:hypothetical protein
MVTTGVRCIYALPFLVCIFNLPSLKERISGMEYSGMPLIIISVVNLLLWA